MYLSMAAFFSSSEAHSSGRLGRRQGDPAYALDRPGAGGGFREGHFYAVSSASHPGLAGPADGQWALADPEGEGILQMGT